MGPFLAGLVVGVMLSVLTMIVGEVSHLPVDDMGPR